MCPQVEIPPCAWKRRLDQVLENPGHPKRPPLRNVLSMLPMIWRMWGDIRREHRAGRTPVIDSFKPLDPGPYGGVPLGGIGGGSIMRGWQGGFRRWQMRPGRVEYRSVPADQFSVFIRRREKPHVQVLSADHPPAGELSGWEWGLQGSQSHYYALFPRAWTVYEEPDPHLRLTCRQISPVIPHNYKESSTPASVFVWTIENTGPDAATVGLMFTFQNGTGGENDRAGGHWNRLFRMDTERGQITGVELCHVHRPKPLVKGHKLYEREMSEDPLTFAIAARATDGVQVTYRTRFVTSADGLDVWNDFCADGSLENLQDEDKASRGLAIGAALCATVDVPPGQSREVVFALAWDMPLARFAGGRAQYRRYTRFYGRGGDAAGTIAAGAWRNFYHWEKQIEEWQAPILADAGLPDWYKMALFNELYFIVDGGTLWTDGAEDQPPLPEDDVGRLAYLEGHEYVMYNTYDVHFYASFALAMLWPQLELSLQRDFARAINLEHPEQVVSLGTGVRAPRKVRGAIPHDIGSPVQDPWVKVNSYNIQDTNRWKDLNDKFVLQVYRDVVATGDMRFAREMWNAVREALGYLCQFDRDDDGLIENEGFPDQTYDVWAAHGPSAYTGGLWLAALGAAAALGDLLGEKAQAQEYRRLQARGQAAYEALLWYGRYYNYDASGSRHHDSIMADQMAGQWFAHACNLPPIVPQEHACSALLQVYDLNVRRFGAGRLGAANGMRPDGRVDTASEQSQEVWPGVTFALAAAMLQAGMCQEAFDTAKGVVDVVYNQRGYWFATPEAWDARGNHRSPAYMRPLAIWAIQWAWERTRLPLEFL